MFYLNATCPPGHYHNGFIATGAFCMTHVRLHVPVLQESNDCSKKKKNVGSKNTLSAQIPTNQDELNVLDICITLTATT